MADNKYTVKLSLSEIETINKALSCFDSVYLDDLNICLDDKFEPYYFDDKGKIIKDKSDVFLKDYENVNNINSKLWLMVHSNSN